MTPQQKFLDEIELLEIFLSKVKTIGTVDSVHQHIFTRGKIDGLKRSIELVNEIEAKTDCVFRLQ